MLVIFLLLAALSLLWAFVEPNLLILRREDLPFEALPDELCGFKIGLLTDLHCTSRHSLNRVRRAAEKIAAHNPDVVLLCGDYADHPADAERCLNAVRDVLHPPLGIFAVAGNHDRRYEGIEDILRHAGITPLVNQTAVLHTSGRTLCLMGLDDFEEGHPDPVRAAEGLLPGPCLILAHNPQGIASAASALPHDVQARALCGHTHGGQITVFGLWGVLTDRPFPAYFSQWVDEGGILTLYSNGVGTTALPLRFFAPPQCHVLTLTSASSQKEESAPC